MIEQYLSIQDTIAIALITGILIKLFQFFYFDKKKKVNKTHKEEK